jgi:hypothetical protein
VSSVREPEGPLASLDDLGRWPADEEDSEEQPEEGPSVLAEYADQSSPEDSDEDAEGEPSVIAEYAEQSSPDFDEDEAEHGHAPVVPDWAQPLPALAPRAIATPQPPPDEEFGVRPIHGRDAHRTRKELAKMREVGTVGLEQAPSGTTRQADPKRLQSLREGASSYRQRLEKWGRYYLSTKEQHERGYALLPMEKGGGSMDDKGGTVYHQDASATTAPDHGSGFDTHRGDYAFKLRDGLLVHEADPKRALDTQDADSVGGARLKQAMERQRGSNKLSSSEMTTKLLAESKRYIYVMNSAGDIFAGKDVLTVQHHSSFLAGGAVASAGEIDVASGRIQLVSNVSGHYRPGPAYLWQALLHMDTNGVALGGVKVEVAGLEALQIPSAQVFFDAFDPSEEPWMFDPTIAVPELRNRLTHPRDTTEGPRGAETQRDPSAGSALDEG